MKKLLVTLLFIASSTGLLMSQAFTVDGIRYSVTSPTDPRTVEVVSKTPKYEGDITIPDQVTHESQLYTVTGIADWAFYICPDLTSVNIPESVTYIGRKAFEQCRGLTSFTIPASVTIIRDDAFMHCSNLGSIDIPNSVTVIGPGAFAYCSGLTALSVGASVEVIGDHAFAHCNSLPAIDVDDDNAHFTSVDGVLYDKAVTRVLQFPAGKTGSLVLPGTVTTIGSYSFNGCEGLTSITLPNSLTTIEEGAFHLCTGLTSVELPDSVTKIGGSAFSSCTSLTEITLGESVTEIGEGAFAGCTSLVEITIPSSISVIERFTFGGCSGLESIVIGDSVVSIGEGAFYECTGLTSVIIRERVELIEMMAFYGCTELASITCYAITPPEVEWFVFENVPKTIPLYVPEESISDYKEAFGWEEFVNILPVTVTFTPEFPLQEAGVKLYPNPLTSRAKIEFNNNQDHRFILEIADLRGKVLIRRESHENMMIIERGVLTSGNYVYILHNSVTGERFSGMLIVR